jgi:hypothetical protein
VPLCLCVSFCLSLGFSSAGCSGIRSSAAAGIQNPLFIPPLDRELLWNTTVDVVDDYFRIEREDRVRMIGGVLTEGRIDTYPTTGATLLEPWRRDSTPGYEKLHATLQSIRRRATVRVIPTEGGYLLDVTVQKELEDLDKPEHATAGGATLRHDGTIVRQQGPPGRYSVTLGWIPIGRDVSLEQRILGNVASRLHIPGHQSYLPTWLEQMFTPSDTPTQAQPLPEPLGRYPLGPDAASPELIPPTRGPANTPNYESLPPPR